MTEERDPSTRSTEASPAREHALRQQGSLLLVALGGNALLRRGEPLEARVQQANVDRAARSIAELAAANDIVVTHGKGPQVGLLALQAVAYTNVKPYPLDVPSPHGLRQRQAVSGIRKQ